MVYCLPPDIAMKITLMVLLCLLYALVVVHPHEVPYISFMGTNLPNHSFINLTLVGENSSDGVQCHTDLVTCCNAAEGRDRGDWYYPNGDILNFSKGTFKEFQNREAKRVDLRRRGSQTLLTQGVYHCDIETNAVNNQSGNEIIYAGLYTTGGQ